MVMGKNTLSVANEIKAFALINILDIFKFTLTAEDADIEKRYDTEERALKVAREYLEIAKQVSLIEIPIKGWSIDYSQPIANSDGRREHKACFFDVYAESEE